MRGRYGKQWAEKTVSLLRTWREKIPNRRSASSVPAISLSWIDFKPLTPNLWSGRSRDIDVRLRFCLGGRGRGFLHDRRVGLLFFGGRIDRRVFLLTGREDRTANQHANVFLHTSQSNLRAHLAVIMVWPNAMTQGSRICPAGPIPYSPRRMRAPPTVLVGALSSLAIANQTTLR